MRGNQAVKATEVGTITNTNSDNKTKAKINADSTQGHFPAPGSLLTQHKRPKSPNQLTTPAVPHRRFRTPHVAPAALSQPATLGSTTYSIQTLLTRQSELLISNRNALLTSIPTDQHGPQPHPAGTAGRAPAGSRAPLRAGPRHATTLGATGGRSAPRPNGPSLADGLCPRPGWAAEEGGGDSAHPSSRTGSAPRHPSTRRGRSARKKLGGTATPRKAAALPLPPRPAQSSARSRAPLTWPRGTVRLSRATPPPARLSV